jgi:hypothetical protein
MPDIVSRLAGIVRPRFIAPGDDARADREEPIRGAREVRRHDPDGLDLIANLLGTQEWPAIFAGKDRMNEKMSEGLGSAAKTSNFRSSLLSSTLKAW